MKQNNKYIYSIGIILFLLAYSVLAQTIQEIQIADEYPLLTFNSTGRYVPSVSCNYPELPKNYTCSDDTNNFEERYNITISGLNSSYDYVENFTNYSGVWKYNLSNNNTTWGNYSITIKLIKEIVYNYSVVKNGDCNGDWNISTADSILLSNNISHAGDPQYFLIFPKACEVTGNGVITLGDATRLVNYINTNNSGFYLR